MQDEDLVKQLKEYQELKSTNPNVDVNLLMLNALDNATKEQVQKTPSRFIPFSLSFGLPPIGLFIAIKYWTGTEQDKQTAKICVLLTVVSIILFFAFSKLIFSSSGASINQINNIKAQDIQQLVQ